MTKETLTKKNIGYGLTVCFIVTAVLGAGIGWGLGVFEKYPEYDVLLQFVGGVTGTVIGYYISTALRRPKEKTEHIFSVCFSFFFSCALILVRKVSQFFIDFYTGTNLTKSEFVGDDHWFYKTFGFGMSPWEQRPLMDMGEDFLMGVIGSLLSTGGLYLYIRHKHKQLFKKTEKSTAALFHNFPERCRNKIAAEKIKLNEQTNIFDILLWWCVRGVMLYAFITMENRAEANLLGVILIGTFAVTLLHLLFPERSFLCRISYRVQTLVVIMAFIASYCGNYVFLYNILPRYDLFLHFVSGAVAVTGGYYFALTLVKPETKLDNTLIAVFSMTFAFAIIPVHELVEFVGDFIWGTANQGFYWGPSDDSFFFKVFGHGVGNTQLYYLFDTMYDALLAGTTTIISFAVLFIKLEYKRIKLKKKDYKTDTEKQPVTC